MRGSMTMLLLRRVVQSARRDALGLAAREAVAVGSRCGVEVVAPAGAPSNSISRPELVQPHVSSNNNGSAVPSTWALSRAPMFCWTRMR